MSASLIERTSSAYDYPLLIKHLLHTPLAVDPEQEIVYRDLIRYTYRTLRQRIGRLATGLAALGVKPGDTVAVMDWDSHRYLECYFAIPMMGAVLQTVNIRLSPEQILYTLNHARADVVLCLNEFLPLLDAIKENLETVKTFVLLSDSEAEASQANALVPFAAEYEDLLAHSAPDHAFPDFDENTRATTFYTTGTTGNPKGVYFSHRQLVLHTLAVLGSLASTPEHQRFHRGDVYMPITPMFHVHAWGVPYVATAMGVKQVYPGRYLPENLLTLIQQEGVTFSHCVPTILHMLLTHPASQQVDVSGWKVVIGGSALPKGLAKMAMDRGIDIFGGYGMSETGPVMSMAQLKPDMSKLDADTEIAYRAKAGLPIQLVELRIVDQNMQDVAHDGKTSGEWISSLLIEDIISQYPGVSEVAVVGIPDEKWGERPLALIVLQQENASGVTVQHIQAHVREWAERGVISKWAVPEVRFVDFLEKTSVGKLDKKVLRQKHA
jgi:fatty-acyl-CoA synthase